MKKTVTFLCATLFCLDGFGKSLGFAGETWPVVEMSFLTFIEERLRALSESGELEKMQERFVQDATEKTMRPAPLHLKRRAKTVIHHYRPEMILGNNISDATGNILYTRGTRINALSRMPHYHPCWLFFNADDEAQLKWARMESGKCSHPKLILTGGSVLHAERSLDAVIYFDQAGRITQKLVIQSVPAKVTRDADALLVEEFAIRENGYVL